MQSMANSRVKEQLYIIGLLTKSQWQRPIRQIDVINYSKLRPESIKIYLLWLFIIHSSDFINHLEFLDLAVQICHYAVHKLVIVARVDRVRCVPMQF